MTSDQVSIYDRLGAANGLRAAVDDFYERVTTDPQLAPYFDGVDLPALRRHQFEMLASATGGQERYTGRDMATAHAGLGITGPDFDRVVGHLVATLTSLGVDDATIGEVGAALAPLRSDIVTV
jgi:hemoglobin